MSMRAIEEAVETLHNEKTCIVTPVTKESEQVSWATKMVAPVERGDDCFVFLLFESG